MSDTTDMPAGEAVTGYTRGRQRHAHAVLGRLLELTTQYGMPPIAWTITSNAVPGLHGECLAVAVGDRNQQFTGWRHMLTTIAGAPDVDGETDQPTGETRLVASWDVIAATSDRGAHAVTVTLTASIWPAIAGDDDQADDTDTTGARS